LKVNTNETSLSHAFVSQNAKDYPSGQNLQNKQSEGVRFLLIRHSKYTNFRRRFCPLGCFYSSFKCDIFKPVDSL